MQTTTKSIVALSTSVLFRSSFICSNCCPRIARILRKTTFPEKDLIRHRQNNISDIFNRVLYNFTTCQPREFHLYAHLRHQKLLEGNRRMKYPVSLHWWGIKKIIVLFLLMLIILLFFWAVSFSVVGSCCPFPVASTVWRTIRAKPEQGERGTGGQGEQGI